MFLGEAPGVGFLAAGAEEDFCDEDVFVARPGEFFECGSHLELTLSVGVSLRFRISLRSLDTSRHEKDARYLGRIESIDAIIYAITSWLALLLQGRQSNRKVYLGS